MRHLKFIAAAILLLGSTAGSLAAGKETMLAKTPPMGWNDWVHYKCHVTEQNVLDNAKELVKNGLAAKGYDTVGLDDCWMAKERDAVGNLQADPQRFPHGIKSLSDQIHSMGLKFGIYEDAGYETCDHLPGSGEPNAGGHDFFLQDAKLYASWNVDYLKLDGCYIYVPKGGSLLEAYKKAYVAQSEALKLIDSPIVYSESAPAYFRETHLPDWYESMTWIGKYGQLWREGSDITNIDEKTPQRSRFRGVLWNYTYNLPMGRFQKPGNWNDPDFLIGGDGTGITPSETRTQMALWSMMSAPLILGTNLMALTPEAIAALGNKAIIAVDQDALGTSANLMRRTRLQDVLIKKLSNGDYAIALFNRDTESLHAELSAADFGFTKDAACHLDAQDLWTGKHQAWTSTLQADLEAHDTAIWRVHPAGCNTPGRMGVVTQSAPGRQRDPDRYNSCLTTSMQMEDCGMPVKTTIWTVMADGALKSAAGCLAVADGKPVLQICANNKTQQWTYTLAGNLINVAVGQCLTGGDPDPNIKEPNLVMRACGRNRPDQIWSLPN